MKFGVVLSGGGAAGAKQAGALWTMEKHGIRPDLLVGTSAGSLNAFGRAHAGADGLRDLWHNIRSESDIFEGNYWVSLPWKRGLKSADPLRRLLQKHKDANPTAQIPFFVTSVSMLSGEIRSTPHDDEDIVNMTVSSASIPGYVELYQPETFAWCDGGIKQNLNLAKAVAEKCDVILNLHCYTKDPRRGDGWKVGNPLHNGLRAIQMATEENYKLDRDICFLPGQGPQIFDLFPEVNLLGPLDFKPELIRDDYRYGEQLMEGFIPQLKAALSL